MPRIEELECSMQVGCFSQPPTNVFLDRDDPSTVGMYIPNASYFKLEMSNPSERAKDFRALRPVLVGCITRTH
jgi:hypothetical protein